ncbi:glycosyltransferase, partial [Enterococcus faecium]|nr:glycosyltransferase [Enterococcus faecium]
MDRVIVLMSTYNGEKYIREQLDSIFNQKNIAVKVVIRDDGSND